jgi:hypothetical protein
MPSDLTFDYYISLLLWLGALVYLLRAAWGRRPVVGLSLAYWGQLALIHLLGGVIQLLPWHVSAERTYTLRGFPITGYALAGFLIGQIVFRPRPLAPLGPPRRILPVDRHTIALAQASAIIGLAVYSWVGFVAQYLPGAGAVLGASLSLVAAASCLMWWTYYRSGRPADAWLRCSWIVLVPMVIVLLLGFLGLAINVLISFAAFVAVYYHPRLATIIGTILLGFLGLSLYGAYMSGRDEIRAAVWGGKGFEERLNVTGYMLQKEWSWFNVGESKQLYHIECRLNQNYLVGAARVQLESNAVAYADGETFVNALIALVPRILWPDKPSFAGSGKLVTRFTGITFAEGTSVGIGHVMELFVNYGETGVLVGYIVLGAILSLLDGLCARRLRAGDTEGFLLYFLPGQQLLIVIGNFAELTAGVLGAVILCILFTRFLFPAWVRRFPPRSRPQPAGTPLSGS